MSLKSVAGWVQFYGVRALERVLPPAALWLVAWPFVALAVVCDLPKYGRYASKWRHVPRSLRPSELGFRLFLKARMEARFGRLATFWPDRLAEPRWQRRCRCEGLENVAGAQARQTPVVLATLHFGPLVLLRFLLRARRIPVAGLSEEQRVRRPLAQRMKDARACLPQVPHVFPREELKAARAFLQDGGWLLIPMDAPHGKQVDVPTPHGSLRLGTGAVRLAQSTGARLVPCLIYEESPWRFVVHCGKPAELGAAQAKDTLEAAAQHLVREFLPVLLRHPSHWGYNVMEAWREEGKEIRSPNSESRRKSEG